MKKIATLLLILTLMVCVCTGCNKVESNITKEPSMFVVIEKSSVWRVVYHKKTKVMYAMSTGGYNCGNFTLLVNADGTPMLYDKE